LYLFSQLAWDPEEAVEDITNRWAELHFGKKNVDLVREALFCSYDLWKTTYLDATAQSQLAFKWTMLFQPGQTGFEKEASQDSFLGQLYRKYPLTIVLDSNKVALGLAYEVRSLVLKIDSSIVPNPDAFAGFRRAADLTCLYFQTFTKWRELLWRAYALKQGDTSETNKNALRQVVHGLEAIIPEWQAYPREAKDWLIFRFDPDLLTAPAWMQRTSVAETVKDIRKILD
jgi:hypothetical protein